MVNGLWQPSGSRTRRDRVARSVAAAVVGVAIWAGPYVARGADVLPTDTASKIILKVFLYDPRAGQKGNDIKIAVVGSDADVAAFSALKGQKLDNAKPFVVGEVTKASGAPSGTPDLVFVGSGADAASVSGFTRGAKVMSATNDPSLVAKGIALGVGVDGGKPKVIVNLTASDAEGIKWDPAVLKVAETVK